MDLLHIWDCSLGKIIDKVDCGVLFFVVCRPFSDGSGCSFYFCNECKPRD
jgi:hypothetical protein